MGFGEQDFIGEQVWLTELLAGGKAVLLSSSKVPPTPPSSSGFFACIWLVWSLR